MVNSKLVSLLAVVACFTEPTVATYSAGKGGQINFYTDSSCSKYNGEAACWWNQSPYIGLEVSGGQTATCFSLNMPGNSLSINTADLWEESGTATKGQCFLFDGYGCTGNSVESTYTPGSGKCFASRSGAGWLWKSAWCSTPY